MNDFNLIYFGSPYYSCNVLRSLLDSKFNVTSVISQKSIHQRRNKKKETANANKVMQDVQSKISKSTLGDLDYQRSKGGDDLFLVKYDSDGLKQ